MGDPWSEIQTAPPARGRLTSSRPARRGQSLVEFALALPVFLLLTLGVVDFARIYSAHIALTDGVRKAALYAAEWTDDVSGAVANSTYWCTGVVNPNVIACPKTDLNGNPVSSAGHTKGDPDNIAYQIRSTGLDPARIALRSPGCGTGPYTAAPCSADAIVTITASYQETILTPIIGSILGGRVTMTASTSARVMRSQ